MSKLEPLKQITNIKTGKGEVVSGRVERKSKKVKITILLDQRLYGPHTEEVLRPLINDAFRMFTSFNSGQVTVEEVDV